MAFFVLLVGLVVLKYILGEQVVTGSSLVCFLFVKLIIFKFGIPFVLCFRKNLGVFFGKAVSRLEVIVLYFVNLDLLLVHLFALVNNLYQ